MTFARSVSAFVRRLLRNEAGGTLVEYAMVVALFALGMISVMNLVASNANTQYTGASNEMNAIEESPLPAQTP